MKTTKILTSLLAGASVFFSGMSSANEDVAVTTTHFPLEATFGCTGHKYHVRLDNNEGEVKTCDLSCHTKFHNEKHHVVVYPYESTMVYGTFGRTTTTCDVWCVGQYTGFTQTFTVAGGCGLFE